MEAAGLGIFMISAGVFGTLLGASVSPLATLVTSPIAARCIMGIIMGLTAIGLIYSPWGKRSGAHYNPAVTLAFWSLGKVCGWDAIFYTVAHFVGGTLGVLVVLVAFGPAFSLPPVSYVATQPGVEGTAVAFGAECFISYMLMLVVLTASNTARLARFTGIFAGALVAVYIALEAPLSGMSMNPARSFASAVPAGLWSSLWVYFVAPVCGMQLGALTFTMVRGAVHCAKLHHHHSNLPCIFHCTFHTLTRSAEADDPAL